MPPVQLGVISPCFQVVRLHRRALPKVRDQDTVTAASAVDKQHLIVPGSHEVPDQLKILGIVPAIQLAELTPSLAVRDVHVSREIHSGGLIPDDIRALAKSVTILQPRS